jgi:hypothetical protein
MLCYLCQKEFKRNRSNQRFCSSNCRVTAHRLGLGPPVATAIRGTNDELIKQVAVIYVDDGDTIADVTYGNGVFWKKTKQLNVTGSDWQTVQDRAYDFRDLPYDDRSYDHVVLDPPYIHTPAKHYRGNKTYNNYASHKEIPLNSYADILTMYMAGIKEAARVARKCVWVKCQDTITSGRPNWLHMDIYRQASKLGVRLDEIFILVQNGVPTIQKKKQLHARMNHSYLMIFKIPKRRSNLRRSQGSRNK